MARPFGQAYTVPPTLPGIDPAIGQVLADGGYWHTSQIGQLQQQGREVLVPPHQRKRGRQASPEPAAMQARLSEPETQRDYRRRAQIIEPVFAHIKHHRQITRLLRRGQHAVQAEIDLIATTHNLLKLYRHPPATA
jgi:hypothetical protein